LETVTDLLLGIAGEEPVPASSPLLGRAPRNDEGPEWLNPAPSQSTNAPGKVTSLDDVSTHQPVRQEAVAGTEPASHIVVRYATV
jgi:hypothetical protein